MHRNTIVVSAAIAALGASASGAVVLTDNPLALDVPGFLTAQSLVPINLAGQSPLLDSALTGTGGNGVNQLVSNFSAAFGVFTGTLTSTVYANQSLPGLGVNEVAIVYEFVGNGPSSIDIFNFGLNTGQSLDYNDIINAVHGRLTDPAVTTPGQFVQAIADNSIPASPIVEFLFEDGLDPGLGAASTTERLTWYVIAGGDVRVNVVDVGVVNAGTATAKALAFTTTPGQDDLNVPAPGAAVLGVMAIGLASRRRRR